MAKYDPLHDYLKNLSPTTHEITLTFSHINEILQAVLPYSAHNYQAWWANEVDGNHVHARAWQDAGWKVESVDFSRKRVHFIRKK